MRRAPAETMLFADLHALHVDLDAVERNARVLLERERDLVDEVLGNGADVRAVFDDDVKLDVDPGLGARNDHAAAQARGGQDLRDAVDGVRSRHADDAVAFESRVADHVGQNVVGNMQVARNRCAHDAPFATRAKPNRPRVIIQKGSIAQGKAPTIAARTQRPLLHTKSP